MNVLLCIKLLFVQDKIIAAPFFHFLESVMPIMMKEAEEQWKRNNNPNWREL